MSYRVIIEWRNEPTQIPSMEMVSIKEVQRIVSSLKRVFMKRGKVNTLMINHEISSNAFPTKRCIFTSYNSGIWENFNVKVEKI